MAVSEVDTLLMLIAASSDMSAEERDIVTTLMMKGFTDTAAEAGTSVTGGQTVLNPWPIIGGVGISLRHESEFVRPGGLLPGDVLVLTKPLGTQVAVNTWQWRGGHNARRWGMIESFMDEAKAAAAFNTACESMSRLNVNAARRMIKHGAHGATDVTGFGVAGHCTNLAQYNTAAEVSIELHTLPAIRNMLAVDEACGHPFKLRAGRSAETSGGLMIAFPSREAAAAYIEDLVAADGQPAWIVGDVVPRIADEVPAVGEGTAVGGAGAPGAAVEPVYFRMRSDLTIVEV